jgi:hypothetical protein
MRKPLRFHELPCEISRYRWKKFHPTHGVMIQDFCDFDTGEYCE